MISYEDLLEVFWKGHDPTRKTWSRQYMVAIFYHNDEQKRLSEASREHLQEKLKRNIATQILPAAHFYPAEEYHQKYALRNQPELMAEFKRIYPNESDFVNSTAAARVNGYLHGYGSVEDADSEIDRLGLAPETARRLYEFVKGRLAR